LLPAGARRFMGAVMFVVFIGLAYVWFSTPPRKRDR
jgi:hypothetical protein